MRLLIEAERSKSKSERNENIHDSEARLVITVVVVCRHGGQDNKSQLLILTVRAVA